MNRQSRRQFIQRGAIATAGAIGFPSIVPSSVFGADGQVAPSNRIVLGSIGLGGQGTHNMRAFLQMADTQVVAVCDVERESNKYLGGGTFGREPARRIVNEHYAQNTPSGTYQGCESYEHFRDLLAREDIDAVVICTPDHWHGVIAYEAAVAGKDIYCEKPLTNTIAEGRAVADAVKRYGRVLQTGSHERSGGNARFAAELVRNGYLGKIHTVTINIPVSDPHHHTVMESTDPQPMTDPPESLNYDLWMGPTPAVPYTDNRVHFWWRFIMDYGGGEMTDRGVHIIDLAQLALGMDHSGPVMLHGWGEQPPDGLYNAFMKFGFECEYANGVRMIGKGVDPRGVRFEGTDGWVFIHIHGGRLEAEPQSLLREVIRPNEVQLGRSPGHHHNFINAVKERGETVAPAEVGHRTGSLCHLLNISMQLGRKLHWDPVLEQVIDDPTANRMLARPMRSPWSI